MLSRTDREQYLIGHIPYRLQSLRMCYFVCNLNLEPHPDLGSELRINWGAVVDHNDLLNNPIIESGLVYCRVFLEFLGIARDRKTGELKEITAPRESGDIFITDFGLPRLTTTQAVSGFDYASPDEVEAAICNVIENANKAVAHLTSGPKLPATYPSLKLACRVVTDLVHRHLYIPLGEDPIVLPIEDRALVAPTVRFPPG